MCSLPSMYVYRFSGNQLSVVVTRDIAPQEEVSLCYGEVLYTFIEYQ